ncbi:GNAT family N-acetyltransferase [Microbacterium sp.]|uniref:GNAT family N-acetyltransferase n=1 Tax=Microbacterium sp. TaxID=51671 RepID=UPI0028114772|nr:GNAT family N-acetyltransferase [Microbacterium sp.]
MSGWRRITEEQERRHRIDASIERVLRRRSAAEGVEARTLKTSDGDFWVRETADGRQTHGVWVLPGGPPTVLGDIEARDGDAHAAWDAIRELASQPGMTDTVAFSAFRGDGFAAALADAAPVRRIATKMQREVSGMAPPEGITTRPMTTAEFDDYLAEGARSYADELLANGAVVDAEAAMAEAEASMARMLPEGLDTPGEKLWIVQDRDARPVGLLWVHFQTELAFIYDIEMRESVRGLGYGTQTLRAAAAHTRDAGLPLLALNVFGSNDAARRLYTREGFVETEAIWSADASGRDGG